jgi:hypothetical protein
MRQTKNELPTRFVIEPNIVARALEFNIFDKQLFDNYNILTSNGVQERVYEILKGGRFKVELKSRYIINKNLRSIAQKVDSSFELGIEEKIINAEKSGIDARKDGINVKKSELLRKNPQKPAFMDTKEKEKEKEKHIPPSEMCGAHESCAKAKRSLPSVLKTEIERVLAGEPAPKASASKESMDSKYLLWFKQYAYNPYTDSLKNGYVEWQKLSLSEQDLCLSVVAKYVSLRPVSGRRHNPVNYLQKKTFLLSDYHNSDFISAKTNRAEERKSRVYGRETEQAKVRNTVKRWSNSNAENSSK